MNLETGHRPDTAEIRPAVPADFRRIAEIYHHHVLHGTATFELEPPDADEMLRRHAKIAAKRLPWVVAVSAGRIVGYGYAGEYRARPAYQYTVEDSVYLDPAWHGQGIGRRILERVIDESTQVGCRQMVAVIGDSANTASIALHRALGFENCGVLRNVGLKFGRWLDTVIMQRSLGAGAKSIPHGPG